MSTGSVQDITSPTTTTTTTAIKKTLLPPLKKGVMVDIDDIKPNNGVIVSTPTTTTTTTTNAVGVNGSAHHRTSPPTLNLKPSSIVSSGVAPAADLYDKYFLRPVDWALLRSCEAGDVEDVYQSLWAGASINCRKPIYNLT